MGQPGQHVLVRPGADPSLRGSLLDPHLHRAGPGPGRHQNLSQWSASPAGGGGSVLHSHWSSPNNAQLSLVESLHQQCYAMKNQHGHPIGAGSLWHNIAGVATPRTSPRPPVVRPHLTNLLSRLCGSLPLQLSGRQPAGFPQSEVLRQLDCQPGPPRAAESEHRADEAGRGGGQTVRGPGQDCSVLQRDQPGHLGDREGLSRVLPHPGPHSLRRQV